MYQNACAVSTASFKIFKKNFGGEPYNLFADRFVLFQFAFLLLPTFLNAAHRHLTNTDLLRTVFRRPFLTLVTALWTRR